MSGGSSSPVVQHVRSVRHRRANHRGGPASASTAYAESKVRAEEALSELADADFAPVFMRNATAYVSRAFVSTSCSTTSPPGRSRPEGVDHERRDAVAPPRAHSGHQAAAAAALVAQSSSSETRPSTSAQTTRTIASGSLIVRETFVGCEIEYAEERSRSTKLSGRLSEACRYLAGRYADMDGPTAHASSSTRSDRLSCHLTGSTSTRGSRVSSP